MLCVKSWLHYTRVTALLNFLKWWWHRLFPMLLLSRETHAWHSDNWLSLVYPFCVRQGAVILLRDKVPKVFLTPPLIVFDYKCCFSSRAVVSLGWWYRQLQSVLWLIQLCNLNGMKGSWVFKIRSFLSVKWGIWRAKLTHRSQCSSFSLTSGDGVCFVLFSLQDARVF